MRTLTLSLVLLALVGAVWLASDRGETATAEPLAAQSALCLVPETYLEAAGENSDFLFTLLGYSTMGSAPLLNSDTLPLFYANLSSMRRYHEGQRAILPACAQAYNAAMTDTLAAAQDVTMTWLVWLDSPSNKRAESRAVAAQTHFVAAWSALAAAQQSPLTAME